jgi:hypothetical protein
MSVSQVESILGKGESQASSNVDLGEYGGNVSSEVMIWQAGTKVISITFSNGKVMAKAQNGEADNLQFIINQENEKISSCFSFCILWIFSSKLIITN